MGRKRKRRLRETSTVEDLYKKKDLREQILLRPDTYIGSTEKKTETLWVFEEGEIVNRPVTYVPGLCKIFDEILLNAVYAKQKNLLTMTSLRVDIDVEENRISVYNNGAGVPVEEHQDEGVSVPEMVFGSYNDRVKKTIGGRTGYGANLTNIFSTEFEIETADGARKKKCKLVFNNNMDDREDPIIEKCKKSEKWTRVSFTPDLNKFGMARLDEDLVALMSKRVFDIAGCFKRVKQQPKVKVELNGQLIQLRSFEHYVNRYPTPAKKPRIHYRANDKWEIGVGLSEGKFQQVSFVNFIATIKGGTHVEYVIKQITDHIVGIVNKNNKEANVQTDDVKDSLWLFVNCLIEDPIFDSQTNESLTLEVSKFGSTCILPEDILNKVANLGVVEDSLRRAISRQRKGLPKNHPPKAERVQIDKLEDAHQAGGKNSRDCTLILAVGDSAKALAMAGLHVVGHDFYGVYPIRGNLANVMEVKRPPTTNEPITKNFEFLNIMETLGLKEFEDYTNVDPLRYGHVLVMNNQDPEDYHETGLFITFLYSFWPNLLKIPSFLSEFVTPAVKATHRNELVKKVFYTVPEYEEWLKNLEGDPTEWTIKHYKGLAASTSKDGREYFSELHIHKKDFVWDEEDGKAIVEAFGKKKEQVKERNQCLPKDPQTSGTTREQIQERNQCMPEDPQHDGEKTSFSDFMNKKLILFSRAEFQRSIPSVFDGLKPGQRKILFCSFKKIFDEQATVDQLSGYVFELSTYHHRLQSLLRSIISMAQDYIGSNNLNLLEPIGQFGTRLTGGIDAGKTRHICIRLAPAAKVLFPKDDDDLLDYLNEDGKIIEPARYMPIIPIVLVNGCDVFGMGYRTFIPNYNPREIVASVRYFLEHGSMDPASRMQPWYRGFEGSIEETKSSEEDGNTYTITGVHAVDGTTIRITELPIGMWTDDYKLILERMKTDNGPLFQNILVHGDDRFVDFELQLSEENMKWAQQKDLLKLLKLTKTITTMNMFLLGENGVAKKYKSPEQIIEDFIKERLAYYNEKKEARLENLSHNIEKLDNRLRFIKGLINRDFNLVWETKVELVDYLRALGFAPFPVGSDERSSYDYLSQGLVPLPIVQNLEAERDELEKKTDNLKRNSEETRWLRSLDALDALLNICDQKDIQDRADRNAAQVKFRAKAGASETPEAEARESETLEAETRESETPEASRGKRRRTRSECKRGLVASEIQPVTAEVEAVGVSPKKKMRKMSSSLFTNEEEESIESVARNSSSKNIDCGSASSKQYVEQYCEGAASAWTDDDVCDRQEAKPYNRQRLLVVVNRLPVSVVRRGEDSWSVEISDGGLVGALSGVEESDVRWIGWAGVNVPDEVGKKALSKALAEKMCIPVFFDEENVRQDYDGYCNNILWTLFHFLGLPQEDRLARSFRSQFAAYKKANQTFADVVNEHYEEGDVIWCHDYHLMFLPKFLKEHNIKMKVGWFLHTPFPSSEIHRTLPSRSELLRSVLAADLVGFHTNDYVRDFVSACTRIIGLEGAAEGVVDQGRVTRVADFPMGIDSKRFIQALEVPEVMQHMKELKEKFAGKKVMLGVDRLDMSKGIPQKILAFEIFLEENPNWRDKVVLLQIAVPTRTEAPEYQKLRSQVHETLGRINSRFGRLTEPTSPIHYLDHSLDFHALCAVYAVTDIALITPLRDGMNLVSYEFVACQQTKKGVLILSEFAGAAQSLSEGAILVNPWNITDVAASIGQALNMSPEEREKRHEHNFHHVTTHTAQQWAESFVRELIDTVTEA